MSDGTVAVLESTDPVAKKIDNESLTVGGVPVFRQRLAIPDGADVAEGATTDVAWVSGAGSLIAISKAEFAKLEAIRALLAGTLTVGTHAVTGTVTANAGTGPFPVSDNAGSLTVDAPVGTPVASRLSDGTAFLTTTGGRLAVDASGVAVPITDNAGTLTVDAPVATPLFARLSDGAAALAGQKTMANSIPVAVASDQSPISAGGTNVLKTGTITTTAVTADQVVLTYTVTALKTFYLTYIVMYGRLTVLAATATILGAISLETPSGTKVLTLDDVNPTTSELEFNPIVLPIPIPIAAGVVVRVVVTPAAATSMLWRANFGGYEK